jgi:hypothetical protein
VGTTKSAADLVSRPSRKKIVAIAGSLRTVNSAMREKTMATRVFSCEA